MSKLLPKIEELSLKPRISRFPYSKLPLLIRKSILDSTNTEDALKLLKANKKLRFSVLKAGVFPKKVAKFKLMVLGHRIEGKTIEAPAFQVTVTSIDGKEQYMESHIYKDNKPESWEIIRNDNYSKLFKKIRSVKNLEVSLTKRAGYRAKPDQNCYQLLGFLPNFRYVSKFSMDAYDFKRVQLVFEKFQGKITDKCKLRVEQETFDQTAKKFMQELKKKQLKRCRTLDLPPGLKS